MAILEPNTANTCLIVFYWTYEVYFFSGQFEEMPAFSKFRKWVVRGVSLQGLPPLVLATGLGGLGGLLTGTLALDLAILALLTGLGGLGFAFTGRPCHPLELCHLPDILNDFKRGYTWDIRGKFYVTIGFELADPFKITIIQTNGYT
jgi:hypothetical protein